MKQNIPQISLPFYQRDTNNIQLSSLTSEVSNNLICRLFKKSFKQKYIYKCTDENFLCFYLKAKNAANSKP